MWRASVRRALARLPRLAHRFEQRLRKIAGKKTRLIAPNRSATLKVKLKKGSYRYLCTVPSHADAGMKGKLRVR